MNVIETIKNRSSVRTYDGKSLEKNLRDDIINYLNNTKGPFDVPIKFEMIDIAAAKSSEQKLGTYGVIKRCPTYIIAVTPKEDRCMEELGYVFEQGILYATSLGLGTCWLGGTFKRSEWQKTIKLDDNDVLPIISPIGYPEGKRSFMDSFIRFAAGSKNRKPFETLFFNNSWDKPMNESEAGIFKEALNMVRIAPSASNKQPWRILVQDNQCHFYLERTKGYGKALGYDIQKIDMGIAMCHFELTMKEQGYDGHWVEDQPRLSMENETKAYSITYQLS
ncbi:nitroreductase family protein [Serpentinicella sp. ANB-PHB4]|uniref:nitroreductase family protein n=1 Tax=Serpentinicella sp. ANB-PHB4 TaxID=3074076 RepID=UPI0028551537|nr:nitroreductase family protein [Serpentinicella sp. ANB-PHB4]MDR5658681.1 nitroreductase family protein [Serpentinicella sp. ANB-PHB4]